MWITSSPPKYRYFSLVAVITSATCSKASSFQQDKGAFISGFGSGEEPCLQLQSAACILRESRDAGMKGCWDVRTLGCRDEGMLGCFLHG